MDIFFVFGWYALLIAIIGDLLVSTILSLFYKEYSIATMSISALGNPKSPVRLPFNIWMFLEGILFLLSLPVLYNRYHLISGWITIVLIAFIAVFGNSYNFIKNAQCRFSTWFYRLSLCPIAFSNTFI